jgi:hypothetical protein
MTNMSGLRDTAAACAIVGGMLVLGPGVGVAAAYPDDGRHHGENHDHGGWQPGYGGYRGYGGYGGYGGDGQTGATGGVQPHRPVSIIRADTVHGARVSVPSLGGLPQVAVAPRGVPEHHFVGLSAGRSVELGGGVLFRGGVDVGDGVRIGGGVRIGRDPSTLQSANPNVVGPQNVGPTPAAPALTPGNLAPSNLAPSNLPNSVQPSLRIPSQPGAELPSSSSPAAIPPIPATPPVPIPATPPAAPVMPPTVSGPVFVPPPVPAFVPPPVASPAVRPPSALPSGPSTLSQTPEVQATPPPPNAPLTSIAEGPPGRLPYRAGYSGYLQRASISEVAAVAVPGVTGIGLVTASGVFVGYRRAKAGHMIQMAGISRFIS